MTSLQAAAAAWATSISIGKQADSGTAADKKMHKRQQNRQVGAQRHLQQVSTSLSTDNALIPMEERVVGRNPLVWLGSKITRRPRHDNPAVRGRKS